MNKRQILASINEIANELDKRGLYSEANSLTNVMKRIAEEEDEFEKLEPIDQMKTHISNAYQIFNEIYNNNDPTLKNEAETAAKIIQNLAPTAFELKVVINKEEVNSKKQFELQPFKTDEPNSENLNDDVTEIEPVSEQRPSLRRPFRN